MSNEPSKQTLGKAIDEVVSALDALDVSTRIIVIRAVCGHLSIPIQSLDPSGGSQRSGQQSLTSSVSSAQIANPLLDSPTDIRTLKGQKNPSSAREMACLVAYYLQASAPTGERKDEITPTDLDRYFKQAGFPLPKNLGQLLVDSKAAGFFDSTERGTYKLNPVGYNLVVHALPRGASTVRTGTRNKKKKTQRKK
jgi:hypothetical protein